MNFCPKCGASVVGRFCHNCGYDLDSINVTTHNKTTPTINAKAQRTALSPNLQLFIKIAPSLILLIFAFASFFIYFAPVSEILGVSLGNVYQLLETAKYVSEFKILRLYICLSTITLIYGIATTVIFSKKKVYKPLFADIIGQSLSLIFIVLGIILCSVLSKNFLDAGTCPILIIVLFSVALCASIIFTTIERVFMKNGKIEGKDKYAVDLDLVEPNPIELPENYQDVLLYKKMKFFKNSAKLISTILFLATFFITCFVIAFTIRLGCCPRDGQGNFLLVSDIAMNTDSNSFYPVTSYAYAPLEIIDKFITPTTLLFALSYAFTMIYLIAFLIIYAKKIKNKDKEPTVKYLNRTKRTFDSMIILPWIMATLYICLYVNLPRLIHLSQQKTYPFGLPNLISLFSLNQVPGFWAMVIILTLTFTSGVILKKVYIPTYKNIAKRFYQTDEKLKKTNEQKLSLADFKKVVKEIEPAYADYLKYQKELAKYYALQKLSCNNKEKTAHTKGEIFFAVNKPAVLTAISIATSVIVATIVLLLVL